MRTVTKRASPGAAHLELIEQGRSGGGDVVHGPVEGRSIKTLREPFTENVTDADVRAAALQYVRKVSGFRAPAAHNAEAFDRAVDNIASATAALLDQLEVRSAR